MEASAHWKFISRNNMSLNCKIGIEREYALLSIDPAHQKSHLAVCAKTNTAVLGLLMCFGPTGTDHLLILSA